MHQNVTYLLDGLRPYVNVCKKIDGFFTDFRIECH
ncbi:hypothetical protein DFQ01_101309 [Paenibacillus cellulosilyticus]|uniref:Uncharacterized protein n=1 Tax=Paenibacillus cellulosilyticus TaxID=375489 RepID=A0A2V2Z2U3_9BACL|nr:hypothetical protein DFQ01_101309 [Paenibacillus cellulosilyticus]